MRDSLDNCAEGLHGALVSCPCTTDCHYRCLSCGEHPVAIIIRIGGAFRGCFYQCA